MFAKHEFSVTCQNALGEKSTDRDMIALHVGRILQSCAAVENAIFQMIASRHDIADFATIHRSKGPAFRNVMSHVRKSVETSIAKNDGLFKNPKRLIVVLSEFDKVASARSDLAHAEFIASGEIEGTKIVIVSNEGIEGTAYRQRKVQIVPVVGIIELDRKAHSLANTLCQIFKNQIGYKKNAAN